MNPYTKHIYALLYASPKPLTLKSLSALLSLSEEETKEALEELRTNEHGLLLIERDNSFFLGTHPESAPFVEKLFSDESQSELSKAAAETLAVILYYPNPTKAAIEYIRGVNATYSLRSLLMRGLIIQSTQEGVRGTLYSPTIELLQHYGVASVEELPQYHEMRAKIESALVGYQEE